MKESFDARKALLRVGWLAVLLGLTMEAVLVALAAGYPPEEKWLKIALKNAHRLDMRPM